MITTLAQIAERNATKAREFGSRLEAKQHNADLITKRKAKVSAQLVSPLEEKQRAADRARAPAGGEKTISSERARSLSPVASEAAEERHGVIGNPGEGVVRSLRTGEVVELPTWTGLKAPSTTSGIVRSDSNDTVPISI